ncbi:unnamed protein product (macronuclear) [Paramecium tetraurelia]|uniref:B box-type domain-containing protein n=1 Tax=Paramecium tetraurelia TaxID=5888 RepID=A0EEB0_PARTE|nr:uncharacterized protein GSPATT00025972001 [Paramecium tetraurelia]CAK93627.1 unnamed protein product [Paramecium tetraurelia]|eukprot:XP_001461024.1 hypothetical protein (macronuclear) [Paramecium tetraurelia strain d4-2]
MISEQLKSGPSTKQLNSEDTLRVGECTVHKRQLEAFCTSCHVLICPTCLMFGDHKGHLVDQMDKATKVIRSSMDQAAKDGILRLEKTETVLVDIRHTKLTFEESKQKVLKEVEQTFALIFKLIKQRKDEVINLINQHYEIQVNNIDTQEQIWMDKQSRAYDVIKLAKSTNDYQLLEKATYILESLEILRQTPTYKNVYIVNSIDTTFNLNNISLNLSEFQKGLQNWIKLGDSVLIQFKC